MSADPVSIATQLAAAEKCAREVLERSEARSPVFAEAIRGHTREVLLGLLAITFLDGVKYGATSLAESLQAGILAKYTPRPGERVS